MGLFAIFGVILILIFIFFFSRRNHKPPTKVEAVYLDSEHSEISNPNPKNISSKDLGKDSVQVIDVLKSNDGRLTQKELRRLLNFSEAKMSLIIAELEHDGFVRKFKRGRGNILRLLKER